MMERLRTKFSISKQLYREVLAEFFCTAILLFGGTSTVAQFVVSYRQTDEWVCVAMGWGIALWLAVQMGMRISEHLFSCRFLIFVAAQNAGAFMGALGTFIVYYDGINAYDGGTRQVTGPLATAGIFATYPKPYLSTLGGFLDQVFGTAILCLGVAT
ncbi:aquaporin-9 domain protein, partial [Oesophagostomum dentatum]